MRERQAFGASLFDKQVVRQRLAMLDAKTRAARAFIYHCAWRVTQGQDVVQEVSMLKALTGELVNEVVQSCQQFHGGMGYMRDTADRAPLARRPRAGDRRRRDRGDARRGGQALLMAPTPGGRQPGNSPAGGGDRARRHG